MMEKVARHIEDLYNCSLLFMWKEGVSPPVCGREVAETALKVYRRATQADIRSLVRQAAAAKFETFYDALIGR